MPDKFESQMFKRVNYILCGIFGSQCTTAVGFGE